MLTFGLLSRVLSRYSPALLNLPRAINESFDVIRFTPKMQLCTPPSDGTGGKNDKLNKIQVIDIKWEEDDDFDDDEDDLDPQNAATKCGSATEEDEGWFGDKDGFRYRIVDGPDTEPPKSKDKDLGFRSFIKWAENSNLIRKNNEEMRFPSKGADFTEALLNDKKDEKK